MTRYGAPGGTRSHPRRARRFRLAHLLAAVGLVGSLGARAAHGHGTPIPLDFWGAFGRATARCQRHIGSSAASCALGAWRVRRACLTGELAGTGCDAAAARAAVEALRIEASSQVGRACTEQQAANLVFLGTFEAANDAVTFCRDLETAAMSAVALPVASDPATTPDPVRACVEAAADATSTLLHRSFRSRQRLLDRIAQQSISPRRKRTLVEASTAAIARDTALLAERITEVCPAPQFEAAYGRPPAEFLALIASRADCLAGQTYAQGGILCPAAVCGNGMQEPGERCDDGGTEDGDGCSARCELE